MPSSKRVGLGSTITVLSLMSTFLVIGTAEAQLVLEEQFDYPAGNVNSTQAGGTGFAVGGWTSSPISNSNVYTITGGLGFTGLPTAGSATRRTGNPGQSEANRGISGASQTALTADGTTRWFSVLLEASSGSGHRNATMALSDGAFTGPTGNGGPPPTTAGDAFGVTYQGPDEIYAYKSEGGSSSYSATALATNSGNPYLIAGKMEWSAGVDTLTLYNVTDPTAELPASFATVTGNLSQNSLNTIGLFDAQQTFIDEIRFGETFKDVVVQPAASVGATPVVFANYDFTGDSLASIDAEVNTTASDLGGPLISVASFNASGAPSPSLSVNFSELESDLAGAISGDDYYSFTVTPGVDTEMTFTQLDLALAKSGGATNRSVTASLFSSLDGFAEAMLIQDITQNQVNSFKTGSIALNDLAAGVTGPVEFRLYLDDHTSNTDALDIWVDNIVLHGTVVAPEVAVPESSAIAIWFLLGLGLAGFGYFRVRRKK